MARMRRILPEFRDPQTWFRFHGNAPSQNTILCCLTLEIEIEVEWNYDTGTGGNYAKCVIAGI